LSVRRISFKAIGELAPGQTIWDVDVKGFGVRRQRHVAVYILKHRDHTGRQRFVTIGRHGAPWTPDTARSEAKQRLGALAARKGNPETHAGSSSPTLEAFSQTYLESYAVLHKKSRSVAEDRRNLELHILPFLGAKELVQITAADVAHFHTSRGKYRSHPVAARRNRPRLAGSQQFSVTDYFCNDNFPLPPLSRVQIVGPCQLRFFSGGDRCFAD
jgi:hypothetical protein